jgi:hypothetical protein
LWRGIISRGVGDGFQRVVAVEFEGAIDGHENRLGFGSTLRHVSIRVLAHDDCGADFSFGMVVGSGDIGIEEGEDGLAVFLRRSVRRMQSGSWGEASRIRSNLGWRVAMRLLRLCSVREVF